MDEQANTQPARGVLDHIGDLKSKKIEGSALSIEQRHEVVECLQAEGVSTAEISKILGMASRTIRRDLEGIRDANALRADPGMADRMAGELFNEARTCIARIRRTTREKDVSHAVRVDGERAVFQILDSLAARLQSLGHLPTAALKVRADLTHHHVDVPGYDDLKQELDRLTGIVPDGSSQTKELGTLKQLTEKAAGLDADAKHTTEKETS